MEDNKGRLIFVDILKGLAILGVIIFHASLYDNYQTPAIAQSLIPTYLFFLVLPLVILGTFGGAFTLLSGLITTFNIYKRTGDNKSYSKAVLPIILTGLILIILDPFKTIFFDRTYISDFNMDNVSYSLFSRLFETGEFIFPGPDKLMQIGLLPSIALSSFLLIFLLWILLRNNGRLKLKRNLIILITIGFIWASTYQPLSEFLNPYIIQLFNKGGFFTFLAFVLRWFFGHQLSFFPMGIYALFGSVFALLILQKTDIKIIKKIGYLLSGVSFIGFIVSLLVELFTHPEGPLVAVYSIMDYQIYPVVLLFFSLTILLFLIPLIMSKIDYRPTDTRMKIAQKTLPIRRVGLITLTLYIIEPLLNGAISRGFHYIFNGGIIYSFGTPDPYMTKPLAILLFELTVCIFWFIFIYLWSRINFKYGFEHLIILLTNPLRKEKSKKLDTLKEETTSINKTEI